ncbi:MAG: GNAT family N-acetyltransferase [Chloroflexota bacterium]|nr:GNAT family N-acetyltransferase [Chloroflexota bacterium]
MTNRDSYAPILKTERLILRPMLATDIDALYLIFTDIRVMAAFDHDPLSREQMERWLQRNLDHQEQFGYGLFSVLLKATGELIGDCGLEKIEVEGRKIAELGYDFRSDFWNKGYASEAAVAVRDYAFNVLQLPQLISLIRVGNLASKRVAEKIGMTLAEEFTRYGFRYWKYSLQNTNFKD